MSNPMPIVVYDGSIYKMKSRKTEIPDLEPMERLAALLWLVRNTRAKGYRKATNPLQGLSGAVKITTH